MNDEITTEEIMARHGFVSEDLYARCMRGSDEAWEEAGRYVYGVLSRNCWHLNEYELKDLVNETLLYFLSRGLEKIEQPRAFKSLLKMKAKALAIDHSRKADHVHIQPPPQEDENESQDDNYYPPDHPDCEEVIFSRQALKICRLIIGSLKKECKEILPLYFRYKVLGDGVGKLAEDLKRPLGSVATTVHRCLKKLNSHPQILILKEEMYGMS